MDQPYTQTVRTVLAIQTYKPDDPRPYDDTGWTLDALRHVETVAIADSGILAQRMTPLGADAVVEGAVRGSGQVLLVRHLGDWRSATLPWKATGATVAVAEEKFSHAGAEYPAGTFIVTATGSTTGAAIAPRRSANGRLPRRGSRCSTPGAIPRTRAGSATRSTALGSPSPPSRSKGSANLVRWTNSTLSSSLT
jgi:hypothetical protein